MKLTVLTRSKFFNVIAFNVMFSLCMVFILNSKLQDILYMESIDTGNSGATNECKDENCLLKSNDDLNTLSDFEYEWEQLSNTCFIRRQSVFYFTDENKIRLLLITKLDVLQHIQFYAQIQNKHDLTRMKFVRLSYELDKFLNDKKYGSFAIDAVLSQADVLDISPNIKSIQINVYVENSETNQEIQRPIEVKIKTKNAKKSKNIVLCSKMFNLTSEEFGMFKSWIEINRRIGYDKIILYNHSIAAEPYAHYIAEQNGFVELRPYRYLTHLDIERNLTGVLSFDDLHSLKYALTDVRRMHERISLNDCFLSSVYDYKRVAIMDIDEVIYPKRHGYVDQENLTNNLHRVVNDLKRKRRNEDDGNKCSFDITSYLNQFHAEQIITSNLHSYWFQYAHFMTINETRLLFNALRDRLGSVSEFEEPFTVDMTLKCNEDHSKNITFQINSAKDYEYARGLSDFYEQHVEHELLQNGQINDQFNRLFMIIGSYFLQEGYGKSIHVAKKPYKIGHHESFNRSLRIQLPYQYGYVAHFRECLFHNDTQRVLSIKQINVDFHFLECFN